MTRYLVPVGLSVLDNLRAGVGQPDWDIAPTDPLRVVGDLSRAAGRYAFATAAPADILRVWRERCLPSTDDLDLLGWAPSVSAETSTLAARRRMPLSAPASPRLGAGDSVVLLASETTDGMCAAMLVATVLADGDVDRIVVAQTPDIPAPSQTRAAVGDYRFAPGGVTVVRVEGLTARRQHGFALAAFGIGDVMRAVRLAASGDPDGERRIDVQLSGGYKAMLLHTMALAEILRSVAQPDGVEVTACYLFEDMPASNTEPVFTEIGLRCFSESFRDDTARALSAVARTEHPWNTHLRGIAWEVRNGQPTLNAFGHGYLALLGRRAGGGDEGDPDVG